MIDRLKGKKLLVVSSDSSDMSFVQAAQDLGMSVICCDKYSNWDVSPAKKVADEGWDIDYNDVEVIAKKCRQANVDGVIAGYSEERVTGACRIAKAIGTPFYATEEQINITRNKRVFKDLCIKHGVPVPMDFCLELPLSAEDRSKIAYPVIVKSADNGGRKGISVCRTEAELDNAVAYALEYSKTGQIVIEEYVSGTEMSAIYTLSKGEYSLSCLNDKYISQDPCGSLFCDFVLTPSRHYELFMKTVDEGIRKLLKDIGAVDGVVNFQMIVGEDGIRVFEMGYRVCGNDDYKVIRKNNNIDFLNMLICHSVTGDMGDDLSKDNPQFSSYHGTLCMYLHGGTVGSVQYENLVGKKEIDDICILRQPGTVIVEDGTNRQKGLMVKFSADTLDEIVDLIHYVQANMQVLNTEHQDMTLMPFDANRLFAN